MDIAQVAKKSGIAASALRFYERQGLIHPAAHEPGGRRQYAPVVLEQLALIALGQAAGFSLAEIRAMLTPEGGVELDRGRLAAKAEEIDRTVRGLQALSEGLRHAAACPATSHTACPSFQRLLKAAAAGALGRPGGLPAVSAKRLRAGSGSVDPAPLDASGDEDGPTLASVWRRSGARE